MWNWIQPVNKTEPSSVAYIENNLQQTNDKEVIYTCGWYIKCLYLKCTIMWVYLGQWNYLWLIYIYKYTCMYMLFILVCLCTYVGLIF